jgi:hypothetical protein
MFFGYVFFNPLSKKFKGFLGVKVTIWTAFRKEEDTPVLYPSILPFGLGK